jgi:HK97 family phage major capsid protein
MDAIMQEAADKGETLDAAQKEEHKGLAGEVKDINEHLVMLSESEARSKAAAKPVQAGTQEQATATRAHQVITLKHQLPPGIRFARAAMCVAAAKGSRGDAIALASEQYPDDPGIAAFVKTAVGAGTTANGQGPLLQYTDFMGDFVEYLRPGSIVGKFGTNVNGVQIPSLRRVPFNVRVATQTVGGSAYWVGQGLPKPLTKETFSTITLDFAKVATIVVLTKEEVRFSNPSAEMKVRDDMANAVNARIDQDFINPANAGTANVKPASILSGVAATAVSGTTAAAFRVDFKNLMSAMIAANITPTTGVLIMSSTIALNLSLMMNALGQREFPDITMLGGRLFGFPVLVSEYLTALGSPSTQEIVMVNTSDIYLADDGNVTIDSSSEASLEMLDASLVQDATAGTGASLVSLWQNNLLGLRAEREITWKKRRTAAAAYLSPVAYVPS